MLLDVKNLQVAYGKIKALHGIDFHINDGEIVTIIGANGAGKSSTLRAISRLVPSGADTEMTFSGEDLLKYPPEKVVSKLGITHVPEGRRLFGNLTVLENLQLAAFARKDKDGIQRDIERVFAIFSRLEERKTQKAGTMSGGEQQMLAVGRAFCCRAPPDASGRTLHGAVAAVDETRISLFERNQPVRGNGHPAGGAECPSGIKICQAWLCPGKWQHGASWPFRRTAG